MKKVSIIIPVYNMEDWVESGIKCITEQTYENLEIIIIDDGSKDGSYMKCLAEADKDRRIEKRLCSLHSTFFTPINL